MKQKIALIFSFVVLATAGFAQKKGSLIGAHFNALDVKSPQVFKDNSGPKTLAGLRDQDFGFSISYWRGLTSHLDLSVKASLMFHDYSGIDRNDYNKNRNSAGVELEPALNAFLFNNSYFLNPFITAGLGIGNYSGKFGAYAPAGLGVQANLNNETYIMLQGQYRWTLSKDVLKDNIFYSIGIAQRIGSGEQKPKVVPPPPPPVVVDRDGDGVVDSLDKCPDVAGLAALQGCPDRDGDGIADADDKCPDVAGLAKYNGCPIPDTDGDGVNDEQDKCPNEKGLARYQGCPIPDTDKDGVNDEEDKCPNRPGPASNQGCPEIAKEVIEKINFAAKNIFFATGSSKLLPKSFKSLNEVAALLAKDESLMIDISGHTDNTGKADKNQTLSEARAAAVKQYLVSKGLAENRATTAGFGDSKPIADNKTAAGRAKNRRTEMTVRNF
ncbi:MAG: OmpA family protein [Bacteroidetes bacterium]|nr:OmpA family protein [Bacteroidota bacterium]